MFPSSAVPIVTRCRPTPTRTVWVSASSIPIQQSSKWSGGSGRSGGSGQSGRSGRLAFGRGTLTYRIPVFAFALATTAIVSTPAAAQQPPTAGQQQAEPVVVVSGEGLVKAAPDQAFVTIAAES